MAVKKLSWKTQDSGLESVRSEKFITFSDFPRRFISVARAVGVILDEDRIWYPTWVPAKIIDSLIDDRWVAAKIETNLLGEPPRVMQSDLTVEGTTTRFPINEQFRDPGTPPD